MMRFSEQQSLQEKLVPIRLQRLFQIIFLLFLVAACQTGDDSESQNTQTGTSPSVRSNASYGFTLVEGVIYAEGLSHESINSLNASRIPQKLDIYIPDNNLEKRPAIILIHGGGFSGGSRKSPNIVNLANYFASRGWVAFSIDYRLRGDKGTIPLAWLQYAQNNIEPSLYQTFLSLYPAHRDAKAALRWVFANAASYNIDSDYVSVGGGSAGAIIAITLGISDAMDYTTEIPASIDPTLSTTNRGQSYKISAILDFWGSKVGLDALFEVYGRQRFDATDAPIMIVHGTEDPTVEFINAIELRDNYISTGVHYAYYPLQGYGHGAWNATVDGKRLEKLSFDFIVEQQNLTVE